MPSFKSWNRKKNWVWTSSNAKSTTRITQMCPFWIQNGDKFTFLIHIHALSSGQDCKCEYWDMPRVRWVSSIIDHSPPSAESSWPPPPPLPRAPGMGGLFRYSLTLRQYSSSLSVLGSFTQERWDSKNKRDWQLIGYQSNSIVVFFTNKQIVKNMNQKTLKKHVHTGNYMFSNKKAI